MRNTTTPRLGIASCRLVILASLTIALAIGCNGPEATAIKKPSESADAPAQSTTDSAVESLVKIEDLVLDLTPQLHALARWYEREPESNEKLPTVLAAVAFENCVKCDSLGEQLKPGGKDGLYPKYVSFAQLPISSAVPKSKDPFADLRRQLGQWQDVKFGITKAEFLSGGNSGTQFLMHTKFSAKSGDAPIYGLTGEQNLTWTETNNGWKLSRWNQLNFQVISCKQPLFKNQTETAIPDKKTFERSQHSYHSEILERAMATGKTKVYKSSYEAFMDPASTHVLPSVSVVDIDSDGWDDLFISARWGPTQFLHNSGDGTFTDRTDEFGLGFPGVVNCSLFIDIDNDGDKDVLLGRSLEPVVYLRNDDGKFKNVTDELSDLGSRYLVSAISASDINRDGLIDFYLSTYGPAGDGRNPSWEETFLPPEERAILKEKDAKGHMWLDFAGPANLIVMNRGNGTLETIPVDDVVSQWHHSYQSTWADYDNDGDDDLFVCNDFASPGFLINETPQWAETPVFKDGTPTAFPNGNMSFSMGASWADYDSDGDLDLYVSNMYSKAGKRIMNQIGDVDPKMKVSATGNFLYENRDGKFVQRAGAGNEQLKVHQVGWSYGGQFGDFDNDGHADLYVPSGYFTAPQGFATEVDL